MIDFWRQLNILTPRELVGHPVTVIGAGGIGSPTIMSLSKMGVPEITIYDDDTVDAHNLPNQLYRVSDIGELKVFALKDIISAFSDTKINPIPERFTFQNKPKGIVISGVDSMAARQEIWKTVRYNLQVPMYIEARMGIEVLRIYTINPTVPNVVRWYESKLYDDDKAMVAPCTERAIAYTVFMAAALISNQFKKVVKGEDFKKEIIFDMKNLILMLQ